MESLIERVARAAGWRQNAAGDWYRESPAILYTVQGELTAEGIVFLLRKLLEEGYAQSLLAYIERLERERDSANTEYEVTRDDVKNLTEKVIPNLRERIAALEAENAKLREAMPKAQCQYCDSIELLCDLDHYTCRRCMAEADAAINTEKGEQK
jgi:phage shock protein A